MHSFYINLSCNSFSLLASSIGRRFLARQETVARIFFGSFWSFFCLSLFVFLVTSSEDTQVHTWSISEDTQAHM